MTPLIKQEDTTLEEPPAPKIKCLRRCTTELAPNNAKRNAIRKAKKLEIVRHQITPSIGAPPTTVLASNIERGRYIQIDKAPSIDREKNLKQATNSEEDDSNDMIYQNNKRTKRIDVRSRIGRIKPNREKTSKSYKKWVQCTYCGEYSLNHNIKRHYTRPDHA